MSDQHDHHPPYDHGDAATTLRRGMSGALGAADATGRAYWRSLDELASTPEFQEYVHREFPEAASEWHDPISRRNFLTLMGASLALAGVTGCNGRQDETIVPYVQQPEQLIPGK